MGLAFLGMQMRTAQEAAFIVMEFVSKNIMNIIGGIVIITVGWLIAKAIGKFCQLLLLRRNADPPMAKFLVDILKFLIMSAAILIALGNFGITIAPFVAGLGAIGFGTSFALQGPLSNYAAGMTLIFTKPFRVGDILEVNNQMGQVEDMTLARTLIRTIDGTLIVIPNKKIIGEIIHNYSAHKKLDIKIGVGYGCDIDKAITIVKEIVAADKRVVSKPQSKIGVLEFAESSITIYARLWTKQNDYWELMFDINKAICNAFKKNGINIPFPQRDVHIIQKEK